MKSLNYLLPAELKGSVELAWSSIQNRSDCSILSKKEQKNYDAFGSSKRQQEYLAARTIIDQMTIKMGLNSNLFMVQKDSSGKPAANYNGRPYHISIAHTHQKVLCAISADHPIGVDIERADRPINFDLRERMLITAEKTLLDNVSALQIWTLKEALIKLHGKRLGVNLKECVITHSNKKTYNAEINHDLKAKIYSFNHQNYWLSIAW